MHGIASACIGVCGMSLIAQLYPEDASRSRVMGVILGSVALGVLIGYPFGGILYDFVSKSAPFYILAACIAVNFGAYIYILNNTNINQGIFFLNKFFNCSPWICATRIWRYMMKGLYIMIGMRKKVYLSQFT